MGDDLVCFSPCEAARISSCMKALAGQCFRSFFSKLTIVFSFIGKQQLWVP